tara:strand:+ start:7775 stop:9781 length:2007 start_codon:yes stop_codon:yes gene_type:complete
MTTTIRSTALDFNNIKNNLKEFLANKDEFKDYNFEASGLSNILDVLAHNTHINGLIANFALNESYLGTAQLRSSIVSLAEGIGYVPDTDTSSQAKVRLTFSSNVGNRDSIITVPAYTKFATDVDNVTYTFQTTEAYNAVDDGTGFYEVKTANGSTSIPIYEGTLKNKLFLVGEYIDNPVYVIPDSTIDADTVTVKIYTSSTSTDSIAYQNILNATTISAQSTVYILKESPNGQFELSFGDGVTFGVAPAAGNRIEVEYLSTRGAAANGAAVFSANSNITSGGIDAAINVTSIGNSVGGDVKETIESIRKNAPFQYATQNRMVTAGDYSSLILRNYSTLIKDIASWGGEDAVDPEFGAVNVSINFESNVSQDTITSTKESIRELSDQLSIVSFNLRFVDPITTFIELDTFFQFNPKLTDLTLNAIQDNVNNIIAQYFTVNTGGFKQAFRRSNLLTEIDESSAAILSSRSVVRMQQRFTPSAPALITVINSLLSNPQTTASTQIDKIVDLLVSKRYNDAANFMIKFALTGENYTTLVTKLSSVRVNSSQSLSFPVSIAAPDDNDFIIQSNVFTFSGSTCSIKNKLSSNVLQVVAAAGNRVVIDNVGSYDASGGVVTINYFNPSNIAAGLTEIKLSAVPSNPSAIAPERNELLVFDPNSSTSQAVTVAAIN